MLAVACLGLLAALAVPRQRDLTTETRRTEVIALAGSVHSAAHFGHALWRANGGHAVLNVQRGRIAVVNGYPAAAELARLLEEPETMAFTQANGEWHHRGLETGRRCGVRYAPPPRSGGQPTIEIRLEDC